MKLIDWQDWLNHHIPYYEADNLRKGYGDDPPACVLVIAPDDHLRNRNGKRSLMWTELSERISMISAGRHSPVFLTSDSDQLWLWAFWDSALALFVVMQL